MDATDVFFTWGIVPWYFFVLPLFFTDSEDEQNCEAGSRSKEQIGSRPRNKKTTKECVAGKNKKAESRITSDGSSDEERNESAKGGKESPSPEERVEKKADNAKNGETRGVKTSEGIKNRSSDEESECNADSKSEKSDKISDWDSSGNEKGNYSAWIYT